jgi:hypothetical protein
VAAAQRQLSSASARSLGEDEEVEPQLDLPQLVIGLTELEIKDLAYLIFACNCRDEAGGK